MATDEVPDTDPYAALATIYDDWQERYGAFWRLVQPRLLNTLVRHAPAGAAGSTGGFADFGCGTGALLLSLRHKLPGPLVGVDQSAGMLGQARRKPGAAEVAWVHGPFQTPLPAPVAAAGSFFDALNHAAAPGALSRVLGAVARAVTTGGLFIFDLNNQLGFQTWWQGTRVYDGPDWTLTMEATFDQATGLAQGRAIVERPHLPVAITDVVERCFTRDQVARALTIAGFEVLAAEPWCPMDGDVPGKTWWVARRR